MLLFKGKYGKQKESYKTSEEKTRTVQLTFVELFDMIHRLSIS